MRKIMGWIVIGLIAGWFASKMTGEGGYGIVGDIVLMQAVMLHGVRFCPSRTSLPVGLHS